MTRKKKPLPLLEGIEITDVAAEGKALARVDGMAVFVPYAVPGDIVDLQVRRKKHSFMEAEVARMVKPSPLRVEPFCPHFGVCGGCKWQCLPYEEQLRWKQKQVEDNLQRIGKVTLPPTSPIKGSQLTEGYRNKLEFGFSNRRWMTAEEMQQKAEWQPGVGFHIPGAFDKILNIEECHLMDPVQDRLRNGVRAFIVEHDISFFDLREQTGVVRNMMVRTALPREDAPKGELMVVMQFCWRTAEEEGQAMQVMDYLKREFPEITSLMYVNNTKCNDTIGDLPVLLYAGRDHIIETMEGLRFKVGPKSFYQTNTLQAYELYKVAREFAFGEQLSTDNCQLPIVYDLYTGTGTIANFVAGHARQVIGIDIAAIRVGLHIPEARKIRASLTVVSHNRRRIAVATNSPTFPETRAFMTTGWEFPRHGIPAPPFAAGNLSKRGPDSPELLPFLPCPDELQPSPHGTLVRIELQKQFAPPTTSHEPDAHRV